jgi:hypothetical protein
LEKAQVNDPFRGRAHDDLNMKILSRRLGHDFFQEGDVPLLEPVADQGARRREDQRLVVDVDRLQAAQPGTPG